MVIASLLEAGHASPSRGMDAKPRVISAEIKHSKDVHQGNLSKPHIAGELGLLGETTSEPHWVEVRDGQLLVYPGSTPQHAPMWRLPLRHLNLQPAASGRPRGFSLSRHGETAPIATFQVGNELDYMRWVKTLAAELMRQTPLEAIRFLDILGITATIPHRASPPQELESSSWRTYSPDYHSEPEGHSWLRCSSMNDGGSSDCCSRISVPPSRWMEEQRIQMNRGWFAKPANVEDSQQPLSMIVTKEPLSDTVVMKESVKTEPVKDRLQSGFTCVKNNLISSSDVKKVNSVFGVCKSVNAQNGDVKSNVTANISKDNNVKALLKTFSPPEKENGAQDSERYRRRSSVKEGRPPLPDVVKDLPPCDRRSRTRMRIGDLIKGRGRSVDVWQNTSETESGDEAVAGLIARCQQVEKYVPVKEKRLLFESLCRRAKPRFSSSDNIIDMCDSVTFTGQPRTQSLHDLSKYNSVAVKEICRYFERRGGSRVELVERSPSPERPYLSCPVNESDAISGYTNRRQLQRAEKKLCRLKQNISEAEGNIWRLQDQSNKLNQRRRSESTRIQMAVVERMTEERDRLKKFQEEAFKIQREIDIASDKFGIAASKIRHHSNVR